MDVLIYVNRITDDITLPVNNVEEEFGGTAGNFTRIAAKLGLPFRLYSIVSENSHKGYIKFLKDLSVDTEGIVVTREDYGPVCYAVNDGNDQRYFMAEGPMKRLPYKILDEFYEYMHLGTGNPELNYQLMNECRYDKLVFDPSQEIFYKYNSKQINDFLDRADIIMGNKKEIDFMLDKTNQSMSDLRAKKKTVVMTVGSEGCQVYSEKSFQIPSYGTVVNGNTLGAGDTFRAGFYLGLYNGMDLEESVACGNVVSYNIVKDGLRKFDIPKETILSEGKKLSEKVIRFNGNL
ncbi:PfkB family carbohydrate kinase [Cuniculiplasma sp. SKW4]|uniref:PfkB family carbohydrate kinase n=1 Tax=Cuniculiplasma sp. SKW4 TaxID=3400171 RepID=UPI003FD068E7